MTMLQFLLICSIFLLLGAGFIFTAACVYMALKCLLELPKDKDQ